MRARYLLSLFLICILPGCSASSQKYRHKSSRSAKSVTIQKTTMSGIDWVTDPELIRDYEVRLHDIPFFLGYTDGRIAVQETSQHTRWLIEYYVHADLSDVIDWYVRSMTDAGWLYRGYVASFYASSLFKKPHKECHILMMPENNHAIRVIITLYELSQHE